MYIRPYTFYPNIALDTWIEQLEKKHRGDDRHKQYALHDEVTMSPKEAAAFMEKLMRRESK